MDTWVTRNGPMNRGTRLGRSELSSCCACFSGEFLVAENTESLFLNVIFVNAKLDHALTVPYGSPYQANAVLLAAIINDDNPNNPMLQAKLDNFNAIPNRQHNAEVIEVGSNTDDSEVDIEEMIMGNTMKLSEASRQKIVFQYNPIGISDASEGWFDALTQRVHPVIDEFEINETEQVTDENKLIIVPGFVDNKQVRVLIDCGASNMLCHPDLANKVIRSKEVQAEGFDRHCSGIQKVKIVCGSLRFGQCTFSDLNVTEWDLGKKGFDVTLGKPWFFIYNPIIDRRNNRVLSVSSCDDAPDAIEGLVIKVTTVQVSQAKLHPKLAALVNEFSDVFPTSCPIHYRQSVALRFDLTMKPDAKPQYRHPFRLSKVEKVPWTSLSKVYCKKVVLNFPTATGFPIYLEFPSVVMMVKRYLDANGFVQPLRTRRFDRCWTIGMSIPSRLCQKSRCLTLKSCLTACMAILSLQRLA